MDSGAMLPMYNDDRFNNFVNAGMTSFDGEPKRWSVSCRSIENCSNSKMMRSD